ncbi:putative metallocarboxypeptidase ecm14 [Vermiconidia calcicola]|uniref:Metallocarboxypeptidase ecm14 n=1 Tax=Vermiconidia calcicola TaxID=1690605 RepID=A0ACC3MJ99_9PEZI|nr:putative metallocarboxypeptidase ecm14 [Vermiconidia calcicola]
MRLPQSSLLALPALLSVLVVAVPSPAASFQQSLRAQSVEQQQPLWKSLSNRLIGSLWRIDRKVDSTSSRRKLPSSGQAPAHTLARYGGDVVVRFNVSTAEEAQSLADAADTLLLDVWEFAQDWVDIRLAKDVVPSLLGLLPPTLQNSHTPLLSERDLAQAIYDTYLEPHGQVPPQTTTAVSPFRSRPLGLTSSHTKDGETNIFFQNYQPLSVIEPWMHLLASLFTTHVRLINIGVSYEGRDIPALRVGVHPTNNEDPNPKRRKTVLITGGVHAREWISTATVNYIAYSLITGYGKIHSITNLLQDFDFVFVPTLNPDGYVYTWDTDRLWRKNRQRTTVRFCQGVDLDRGYGFEWDGVSTAGNPCSENFAGEAPFDAFESKRLADWAKNETDNNNVEFIGFLDLHSYSQQILYPYSYSCKDAPPGQENLEELALGLGKAIRMSSSYSYEVMAACEGNVAVAKKGDRRILLPMIEGAGGSALDWFYHEMGVRYAYQIKLRDRGTYGFLLPKENIVPTGKEMFGAVMYLGEFLQDLYIDGPDEEVEIKKPDLEAEVVAEVREQDDADEDDWVIVEDLLQEELEMEDFQWELRRRRKR